MRSRQIGLINQQEILDNSNRSVVKVVRVAAMTAWDGFSFVGILRVAVACVHGWLMWWSVVWVLRWML